MARIAAIRQEGLAARLRLRRAADSDLPFLGALYASTRADEMALTGWPQARDSLSATMRTTPSGPLPTGKGVMMRTGRFG